MCACNTHRGQDSAWTKLLTLNLQRVFTLTQKCLPLLKSAAEQGGMDGPAYKIPARVINVWICVINLVSLLTP